MKPTTKENLLLIGFVYQKCALLILAIIELVEFGDRQFTKLVLVYAAVFCGMIFCVFFVWAIGYCLCKIDYIFDLCVLNLKCLVFSDACMSFGFNGVFIVFYVTYEFSAAEWALWGVFQILPVVYIVNAIGFLVQRFKTREYTHF